MWRIDCNTGDQLTVHFLQLKRKLRAISDLSKRLVKYKLSSRRPKTPSKDGLVILVNIPLNIPSIKSQHVKKTYTVYYLYAFQSYITVTLFSSLSCILGIVNKNYIRNVSIILVEIFHQDITAHTGKLNQSNSLTVYT